METEKVARPCLGGYQPEGSPEGPSNQHLGPWTFGTRNCNKFWGGR